jgi:hypothetical protein
MMGLWTPETCLAVNKRQDNKLEKLLHLVGDLFELKKCSKLTKTVNLHVEMSPEVIGSTKFLDCSYWVRHACLFAQFVRMETWKKEVVMHL